MSVTFSGTVTGVTGGVQQAYALQHDPLLEGQLSDIRDNTIATYINETGGVIAFGNAVIFNSGGTADASAKTVSGTALPLAGVNVLTYVDETALDGANRPGVKATQAMNVANEGAVAVYVHGTVSPATAVRVIHTASGTLVAGQFAATSVSGKTALVSNARYLSSVTGSGLAILELNGPSLALTADTTTA
jgi:hypothetical protein